METAYPWRIVSLNAVVMFPNKNPSLFLKKKQRWIFKKFPVKRFQHFLEADRVPGLRLSRCWEICGSVCGGQGELWEGRRGAVRPWQWAGANGEANVEGRMGAECHGAVVAACGPARWSHPAGRERCDTHIPVKTKPGQRNRRSSVTIHPRLCWKVSVSLSLWTFLPTAPFFFFIFLPLPFLQTLSSSTPGHAS